MPKPGLFIHNSILRHSNKSKTPPVAGFSKNIFISIRSLYAETENKFYSAETFPFDLAITSSAIFVGAGA